MNELMNKQIVLCLCMYIPHTVEYYSAIKKEEILPFVTTWMDLEGIMLSGLSQIEKDKFHMISIIYAI